MRVAIIHKSAVTATMEASVNGVEFRRRGAPESQGDTPRHL